MSDIERAGVLLDALARCDVDAVRARCRPDAVVYGTDEGERWADLAGLLAALEPMRALGLRAAWSEPPVAGSGWVAGLARYESAAGPPMLVRVTMTFADGLLAHGHFSVEAPAVTPG
jgi:hypothetical protein